MEIEGLADLTPEGSGGFSQVFRATETRFNRTVAAKVLNFRLEDDEARHRFEQECRAMAQLSDHPHIVPLYSTSYTDQGFPVIVMEYFAGGTLLQRAREGATTAELLDVGVKIASALHCAHERRVTHRDVKPQNVLMSLFGQPALTDFGISAITEHRASDETSVGITLAYASPEALSGQANARTDVYSLGATLYTVLAKRRPFDARGKKQSTSDLVHRIMHEEPPELQTFGLSSAVDRTVRRVGMAKDPQARPASAREFGEQLRALQVQEGLEPTPWIEADIAVGDRPDHTDDQSMTIIRTHHTNLDETPGTAAAAEPGSASSWSPRRVTALVGATLALAVLAFVVVWAGGRNDDDPVAAPATPPPIQTPDDFYNARLLPPTDVTIERTATGSVIVSWTDPNDPPAQFEIQRLDGQARLEPPDVVSGNSAELTDVGDAESPCITMRAVRDLTVSDDLDTPACAGARIGGGPIIAAVPAECEPGTCEFRLDADGFFPGGTVSIQVEGPDGNDLNEVFGEAYQANAAVGSTGAIEWSFRPGASAPTGRYRVTVLDDQSGLSSVTFITLVTQ